MLSHPRIRALLAPSRERRRLLALVLGCLLLCAFDCDLFLHEPGRAHGAPISSGTAQTIGTATRAPTPAEPSCTSTGLAPEARRRHIAPAPALSTPLLVTAVIRASASGAQGRHTVPEAGGNSSRTTLRALCRWRI